MSSIYSALRKITGRSDNGHQKTALQNVPPAPNSTGVQAMAASLQRKFARGVQYNSK